MAVRDSMPATAPPVVVVLMGVSGCGKSTTGVRLSKRLGWPFRDADSFHPQANIDKMSRGIALTDEDRQPWLEAIAAWIDERLAAGGSAIVSCSALKRDYRRIIIGRRQGVRLVHLMGDMALIGDRISRRKHHFMPTALLQSQFDTLEEPLADERALGVSVAMSPRRVVDTIIGQLGLVPSSQVP
jgi:carbohydrate kinase (thermoresistant glucokinase family)